MAADLLDLKTRLRAHLRAARAGLSPKARTQANAAIAACLIAWWEARARPPVVAYLALPEEADAHEFLQHCWALGRSVLLPRVRVPGQLDWHAVADPADCRPGAHGIREPDPACALCGPIAPRSMILVPGVGFDRQGGRLGMGGGFYDRCLSAWRAQHCTLIGLAFACQIVEEIPREAHDQSVDALCIDGTWQGIRNV